MIYRGNWTPRTQYIEQICLCTQTTIPTKSSRINKLASSLNTGIEAIVVIGIYCQGSSRKCRQDLLFYSNRVSAQQVAFDLILLTMFILLARVQSVSRVYTHNLQTIPGAFWMANEICLLSKALKTRLNFFIAPNTPRQSSIFSILLMIKLLLISHFSFTNRKNACSTKLNWKTSLQLPPSAVHSFQWLPQRHCGFDT
jgi:hypothetical protein